MMNNGARGQSPKPEKAELSAVVRPNAVTATRLVPTALIIGILVDAIKLGTIRKPPPIPKNPETTPVPRPRPITFRSEEHTSELQSLMRISYAVFCLKKKK